MKPFILVEVNSGSVETTVIGDTQVIAIVLDWDILGSEPEECERLIEEIKANYEDGTPMCAEVLDALDKLEEVVQEAEDEAAAEEDDEDEDEFEDDLDDDEEDFLDDEDEDDLVDLDGDELTSEEEPEDTYAVETRPKPSDY